MSSEFELIRRYFSRPTAQAILGMIPDLINPPPGCRFHPRCPLATGVCQRQKPMMLEMEEGHWVSCHLYEKP